MRVPFGLSTVLLCAACEAQPYPSTTSAPTAQILAEDPPQSTQERPGSTQGPPESNCREFTVPVTVGGQQQQAVGQACEQPDGSWQITQNTPGLPPQVYTLPPQATYAYPYPYPYYWNYWAGPWAFGPPFFFGGSIFLGNGFHHFHHHDGFRHDGFHGPFHGGFHGGGFHRGR